MTEDNGPSSVYDYFKAGSFECSFSPNVSTMPTHNSELKIPGYDDKTDYQNQASHLGKGKKLSFLSHASSAQLQESTNMIGWTQNQAMIKVLVLEFRLLTESPNQNARKILSSIQIFIDRLWLM